MKEPLRYRNGIPFFFDKSEQDFKKDIYERYDEMVVRQTALHLADEIWGNYPMQHVLDFGEEHCQNYRDGSILEVGSGVGRWIGSLAKRFPGAKCWGIDYSYQMLKRANEFWVEGKSIEVDLRSKGFPGPIKINGYQLRNLQFGLSKATDLPFENETQDLVLNSFLLDRLENPLEGLKEMFRILKPKGKLMLITPLNFNKYEHWLDFYPPGKLYEKLNEIGFEILDSREDMVIREPLDGRGNAVAWKCLGVLGSKN
ncbi:MAG: methyltransferase domain-containing protein [Bacteroidetes bacterium]|nr:MAG: methyltransferase domain-containing protein [Bacteroidota bacterium]